MNEQSLIRQNMELTNNRVLKTAGIIIFLGGLATLSVYLSGNGDANLTWVKSVVPSLSALLLLALTWYFLIRKGKINTIAPYIIMTVIIVCISIIEGSLNTSREMMALWFVVVILSIFYFNARLTLYTCILGIIFNSILLSIFPSLLPTAPVNSAIATRFFIYIWAAIAAVAGTAAARRLIDFAIERENVALKAMQQMQMAAVELRDGATDLAASSQNIIAMASHTEEAFGQIANNMEEVACSSQNQAQETEKSYLAIEEVTHAVDNMGGIVGELGDLAQRLLEIVKEGNQTLEKQSKLMIETAQANSQVIQAVSEMQDQSRHIGMIISTISAIADQTNLLALNAAIEAARAGEQGRGFAVVAEEVRKLAEESGKAAASISRIIEEAQKSTDDTKEKTVISSQLFRQQEEAVENTAKMFAAIEQETMVVVKSVQSLNFVHNNVAGASVSIRGSLQSIAAVAQQLAASVEEVSAVTTEQNRNLQNMITAVRSLDNLSTKMFQQGEELTVI